MKEALFLLDGYSLIYRSYFAMIHKPLKNPQGRNSSAVFGFFRGIQAMFDQYKPKRFLIVLDSPTPTFRHVRYPEYKATRQKTPEDLRAQIPVVEAIIEALELPMVKMDGMEADDLIATMAARCRDEGRECFIISGDKDLLQLVGGPVKVLRPEKGGFLRIGAAEVLAERGVEPQQIIDYLALVGDTADNVPGAKGIGEKTAASLLSEFGSIAAIYENIDRVPGNAVRAKLEAARETVALSRDLVILRDDLDSGIGPEECQVHALNLDKAEPLLIQEGLRSVLEWFRAQYGGKSSSKEPRRPNADKAVLKDATADKAGQQDLFVEEGWGERDYRLVTSCQELESLLKRASDAGIMALDTETDGLDPLTARLVGISFAFVLGKAWYLPLVQADTAACLSLDEVRPIFNAALQSIKVVGQNIKFDYRMLKANGIVITSPWFDTMLAAWLLESGEGSYNLDALVRRYLGLGMISFDSLVAKGQTFDQVPLDKACEYSAEDADAALRLYGLFSGMLAARDLQKLFHDVEMPLLPLLADMEDAGIQLDKDELAAFSVELEQNIATVQKSIHKEVGYEFNINSTKQLQKVLFEDRGLPPPKKTKTGYSTDSSVLEFLAGADPVVRQVLRYRGMVKLKSTYVDTLPLLVSKKTGRLHTTFTQTGTATGRISSRDPNLQNIPIKDEEGRRIRKAFHAREGCCFVSADYAQIELVVLAHLSGDASLQEAFKLGVDVHRRTAALIFGIAEAEVSPEQRRMAKTINFGIMYGMSAFRLSNELGIPRAQADAFIRGYFATYRGVKGFIERTIEQSMQHGYSQTILGRRRVIEGINSRNHTEKAAAERVAINTPIQGSAADIVKLAMLKLDTVQRKLGLGARLLLQVHDELIWECPVDKATQWAAAVKETMEAAMVLDVPLRVDVQTAHRWGDLH